MKKRFIIFCISGLLMGFMTEGAGAAESNECQLKRLASLPIETLPDGRIAVPFTVDGRALSFMVDTGGISLTISRNAAEQLNHPVKQTSRKLIGVGGIVMNSTITVDTLAAGSMAVEKLPIYIEGRDYDIADGTMSPDVLKGYDVDIDFARGTLSLLSQEHCRGKVVYWTKGDYIAVPMDVDPLGHIRIPVMLDGKKVMATVDTGSVRSLMSLRTAASIGITEKDPNLKLIGGASHQFYSYPFHTLDLAGVSVSNPHIAIASDSFTQGLGDDLILGVENLRRWHLYIAYGEGKLYITPALAN